MQRSRREERAPESCSFIRGWDGALASLCPSPVSVVQSCGQCLDTQVLGLEMLFIDVGIPFPGALLAVVQGVG